MSSTSAPLSAPLAARAGRARRLASSPTLSFIVRRLLAAIPVLLGVTFLSFVVMNSLPGDAAQELLGAQATPAEIHQLEIKLGLDKPFLTRYWDWLHQAVIGHLGHSLSSGQSVASILGSDLPVTFELVGFAFVISLALAVPLALVSARKPNGVADRLSMMFSMAGLSIAPYVLALVLVYVFAVKLNVLPAIGWVPPGQSVWQNIRYLILPAVSIGLGLLCFYTRLLRADLLEQMQGEDYVVTARAKGVRPWRVLTRHALRNSLFGLITVVALNLGTLLGFTVVIEDIFGIPGIGHELLQAIDNRDIPVIEGIVFVFAVIVVLCNLAADVLYSVLDPRIRYGRPTE
ncbi:MAG TPA: ABC transporter permease [Solirubrobacteraceae bacterium]|jgi:peptide/nickel transport system permease protein|nr:ABC transporter permease [Solirubrobacteraceae bacterium]